MSTVSKAIADVVIAGNGMYPDDLVRVVKVVKYQNAFDGRDAYGLIYEGHDPNTYAETVWVRNPITVWEYTAQKPKQFVPIRRELTDDEIDAIGVDFAGDYRVLRAFARALMEYYHDTN